MKRILIILLLSLSSLYSFSQRGKNGTVTVSATSTVNVYTSLTMDAAAGNTTLAVQNASALTSGDLIYIIQMQGASVNCYINIWGNPNSPEPYDATFGTITAYNNAGNHEYAQVASVSGTVVTLDCALSNNYTAAGKVQVIKVPRYASLSVTGTITCPPWNGTTGGVIAIEVEGITTIGSTGRIDASGRGFRGGITIGKTTGLMGGGSWGHNNANEGGYKGESIAGDVATYLANFNGAYAKGAVANGGGGGNANNCGGGGGANGGNINAYTGTGNPDASTANYVTAWNLESAGFASSTSSGGGRGGYAFSDASISPLTNGPNLLTWNGDARRNQGGYGGRPLDYSTGKIFCGGGGGAGDENDTYGGAGGRGGGIINMVCYGNVSGTGQILANGANGVSTNTPNVFGISGRDGAGGGGGGGAIFVNSAGSISTLTLSAIGGNGGHAALRNSGGSTNTSYGPGAGGGGGYISTTTAAITTSVAGGSNGIVTITGLNGSQIDNLFPPNGATRGGAGNVNSTLTSVATITAASQGTICANNSATVTAGTTGTTAISWYTQNAGGTLLGTGSVFTTSVFATPGTYTVFAGYCPGGTYRVPAVITVTNSPTVSVNSATICSGQSATLTASGAASYSWNTGATSSSIVASPGSTTNYTVTGSNGSCFAASVTTIVVSPAGVLPVNSSTVCAGQNATLTAGAATNYTWSNGSSTSSVIVSPSVTTTYTVNAMSGSCLLSNTSTVTVNSNPTVSVGSATICSGQNATLTASGAANYLWNTSATTASISVSPVTTQVYTVTGTTTNNCSDVRTATVSVNPSPTITVNSATICSGSPTTLSVSGASSYSWSTGSTATSITLQPSVTTQYTVTGLNGTCQDQETATVTVNNTPTVSVNSETICSGSQAVLTAGGANTYSWSTGSTANTISVSPNSSQVYTITGTTNNCNHTRTATVTVNTSPTITVNSATICSGSQATLSVSGASSYSWSTGSTAASITLQPSITTQYTVTGLDGACQDQEIATITVNNTPTVSVNSETICSGSQAVLTAGGANTYSWSTETTANTISVSPNASQVYTVTGYNGNCFSTTTATVTVNYLPSLGLNSSVFNLCSGESATVTALSSENTYTWSTGENTAAIITSTAGTYTVSTANNCGITASIVTVNVSSGPPSFTVVPSSSVICSGQSVTLTTIGSSGTYTWSTGATSNSIVVSSPTLYVATVTNGCGTASSQIDIGGNTAPAINISASSSTICAGGAVTLTANSSGDLLWAHNSQTTSVVTVTATGVYTVTSSNECGSTNASYSVIPGPPPVIFIASSGALCTGQSVTLTASGADNYSWNTGSNNQQIVINADGTFTASGTNACGTSSAVYSATFLPVPQVSLSATDFTICPAQTTTLIANGLNGTAYSWDNFPSNSTNTQTVSSAGIYTVNYSNSCGTAADVVSITESTVQADFSLSPASGLSPLNVSFTNSSINNTMNQWDFGNGENSTGTTGLNITYTTPGIYTVTLLVQNDDGCTSLQTRTLEVIPTEFGPIPEVITPNNDNYNDVFYINGIERFPNNELQIFNRWGNLVYEMKNYNNTWRGNSNVNGKTEGDKLPSGTYFILLQLNNGSGTVYKTYCQLMY